MLLCFLSDDEFDEDFEDDCAVISCDLPTWWWLDFTTLPDQLMLFGLIINTASFTKAVFFVVDLFYVDYNPAGFCCDLCKTSDVSSDSISQAAAGFTLSDVAYRFTCCLRCLGD